MNTHHNAVTANVMLNLSRSETQPDNNKSKPQDDGGFKDVLAAQAATKTRRAADQRAEQATQARDEARAAAERNAEKTREKQLAAASEEKNNAAAKGKAESTETAASTDSNAETPMQKKQTTEVASAEAQVVTFEAEGSEDMEAAAPLVDGAASAGPASLLLNLPSDKNLSLMTVSDAVSGVATELEARVGEGAEDPLAALIAMIAGDAIADPLNPEALETANPAAALTAGGVSNRAAGQALPAASLENAEAEGGILEELQLKELTAALKAEAGLQKTEGGRPAIDGARLPDAGLMAQLATQAPAQPTTSKAFSSQLLEAVKGGPEAVQGRSGMATLAADMQPQATTGKTNNPGTAQFTLPSEAKGALGQPQWHTAVAERVAIMASKRLSSAEIQLDPPELGHLQVRVTLNQEQASVTFASPHQVVRDALDQTAFRLREMFEAEGLNLLDVDVSDQSFQQEQQQQGAADGLAHGEGDGEVSGAEVETAQLSNQLVDHFV